MKKAAIVVGSHFSGKSKTIKEYFKPLVGLRSNQRIFNLKGFDGVILSQSLEEKGLGCVISQSIEEKQLTDLDEFLSKYLEFKWLVLAARPANENRSFLNRIINLLKEKNYFVETVSITKHESEDFYQGKADEIFKFLNS